MEKSKKNKNSNYPKFDGLEYKVDIYKCAKIDFRDQSNGNYLSSTDAAYKIGEIVEIMKKVDLKAIWIIIPIDKNYLIKYFVEKGFLFHHVENDTELYMYKWLLSGPSNLPKYAAHYVGVGGLIINSEGKILLVKEKKTIKMLKDFWKIPTGLTENGETIAKAIEREVMEETGLKVNFEGVMNMRETHPYMFGTTDIFFICLCTCEGEQTINIEKGAELKECRWFTKEEIKEIIREKKFSPFSAKLFKQVLDYLPEKIHNYLWKPDKEVQFLNSKFVFYTPKY